MSDEPSAPILSEMSREVELPKDYGYGPSKPISPCWCCLCGECCFGPCYKSNLPSCGLRSLDCIATILLWKVGAYPGGGFKQAEGLLAGPSVKPRVRNGVESKDFLVPSLLDKHTIPIRAFRKREHKGDRKLIVFFHGGGWCLGKYDGTRYVETCERLAQTGHVVVSVEYRLAPEFPFPTGLYDSYEVVRWLATTKPSDEIFAGIDHTRMSFAGDSAGGNFCLVIASLIRDGLSADLSKVDLGVTVESLVLIYPGLMMNRFTNEPDASDGHFLRRPVREFFFSAYVPGKTIEEKRRLKDSDRRLCPILAGFHNLPRTIMIQGMCDALRHENIIALEVMKRNGVDATLVKCEGMPHGFLAISKGKETSNAFKAIDEFLG